MWCNNIPIVGNIWFSRTLDKTRVIFWNSQTNYSCCKKKRKQSLTRGIPRRSTIQMLSSPSRFWLCGTNESQFFTLWCNRRQETVQNKSLPYCRSERKSGQPSTTINHVHFFTKSCNRLTDKLLNKQCKVNLDLDALKKARNPRMTQRGSKQVPFFSRWCESKQKRLQLLAS